VPAHDQLHRIARVSLVEDDLAALEHALSGSGENTVDMCRIDAPKQQRLLHADNIATMTEALRARPQRQCH
jgi:hypothetical protein